MKKLFYLMVLSVFGLSSNAQTNADRDLVISFMSYSFIYIDGPLSPGDPVTFNLADGFINPGKPLLESVLTSDPLFLNYAVAPSYDNIYVSLETPAGTDLTAFEISIVRIATYPVIPNSLSTPTVGGPLVLVPNAGKSLWVSDLMWKSSTPTHPLGTSRGIEFEIRVTLNDGSPNFSSSYAALNSSMSDASLLFSFIP